MMTPLYVQIVGGKNSGKTTLVCGLIKELTRRNIRAASVKHTSHDHIFDKEGTDSFKHREAGSVATVILSPGTMVCHTDLQNKEHQDSFLKTSFASVDVILWEGRGAPEGLTIELVKPGGEHLESTDFTSDAIVSDETVKSSLPLFSRNDYSAIIDWIVKESDLCDK